MLRSRFFWKLFGSYAILVLLTTLAVSYLAGRYIERTQFDAKVESLRRQCVLLSPYAVNDFAGFQDRLEALRVEVADLVESSGVRVTFIQRGGKVLLDTVKDPDTMDNHRGRPEVQEALVSGVGQSLRFGNTLGQEALYLALVNPIGDDTNPGVVRVSLAAAEHIATVPQIMARSSKGAYLAALLALALGYWGARRLTAPLAEMTEAAKAFQEGDYDQRIVDLPGNELGELGEALNRLGAEVRSRVGRLSDERGRLSAILAGMAEGVIAVDDQDVVSFSNRACERLFHLEAGESEGRKIWEVVQLAGLVELLQLARNSSESAQRELTFAHPKGERRLVAKAQGFQNAKSFGVVVVFEDITELPQLERVRQDFVANVSHELKTPLTSIRGYVETLLEGALYDEEHNMRFLGKIHKNVDRLNALVSDLLSLARIENQEDRLVRERIDLAALVRDAIQRFEQAAGDKQIDLSATLPETPCWVWGETKGLDQVLDNLLSNAMKYTPEGGEVTVELGGEADVVHLRVRDTGIGIPPADQARVFERFLPGGQGPFARPRRYWVGAFDRKAPRPGHVGASQRREPDRAGGLFPRDLRGGSRRRVGLAVSLGVARTGWVVAVLRRAPKRLAEDRAYFFLFR